MNPNERPTPQEEADHIQRAEFLSKHGAPINWVVLTIEESRAISAQLDEAKRKLTQVTQEKDETIAAIIRVLDKHVMDRDAALSKLAKCREALEAAWYAMTKFAEKDCAREIKTARKTLEQTK